MLFDISLSELQLKAQYWSIAGTLRVEKLAEYFPSDLKDDYALRITQLTDAGLQGNTEWNDILAVYANVKAIKDHHITAAADIALSTGAADKITIVSNLIAFYATI